MKTTPSAKPVAASQSSFPVPFTLEQLREDILNIYLLQLRITSLFSSSEKLSRLTGVTLTEAELYNGYTEAREFGLRYEGIQDSNFAKAMEQQYSYAFFGVDNMLCEPMHSETQHTWVAALLHDLKTSATSEEWQQYGAVIDVSRCLHTCELANARNLLEGKEGFYTFSNAWGDENNCNKTEGALTIHQVALLSGMKEMSIRTEISRPSANPLSSFKEERRTLIKIADGKEWLIAKGRYVPVSLLDKGGQQLKLEKTSFSQPLEFVHAVARHVRFLDETKPDALTREKLSSELGGDQFIPHREFLLDSELMTRIAAILDLPAKLFVLRAKESVLKQDLAEISHALATDQAKS